MLQSRSGEGLSRSSILEGEDAAMGDEGSTGEGGYVVVGVAADRRIGNGAIAIERGSAREQKEGWIEPRNFAVDCAEVQSVTHSSRADV